MKTHLRIAVVVGVLGAAAWGEPALEKHLDAAAPTATAALARALKTFPMQLEDWRGEDLTIDDPRADYADDSLRRSYVTAVGSRVVSVWIAYSRDGKDRGHHPEVCMAVAGKAEDQSVRQTFEVPGHAQPVQQYRFGGADDGRWVFYWYYTLPTVDEAELDPLQAAYRKLHTRPAGVTIEVFAPDRSADDAASAREFVVLLDAALQEYLGPQAERGSRRLPVFIIPGRPAEPNP